MTTKIKIGSALICIFFVLIFTCIQLLRKNLELKKDSDRNFHNVEVLTDSLRRSYIQDSIPVTRTGVIEVKKDEFKKITEKITLSTLKDAGISVKSVESIQNTVTTIHDTVPFYIKDSIYDYSDRWIQMHASLIDGKMEYFVKDSVSTIVNKIYKHKFLWWKWGVKGYEVTIINFNPKSKIEYNKYIKQE